MSNFSTLPSVSISRSKFNRKSQHKTSLKIGEITPIYIDEVLPGDTRKIDIGALIRMSTPIAPIMDNIYMDIYAFFVPNRLTWQHWKEFMGENSSGAGIYSGTAYQIPKTDLYNFANPSGSIGDHMGLPIIPAGVSGKHLYVSTLPKRGYNLIYNRFFRDQSLIAPVTVNTGDNDGAGDRYFNAPYKASKFSDYFTRALPYAQKGAPVTIPLGTIAPIKASSASSISDMFDLGNTLKFGEVSSFPGTGHGIKFSGSGQVYDTSGTTSDNLGGPITKSNLYADLSKATSATINQLRFAFQYQKLLEKDSLYGTR